MHLFFLLGRPRAGKSETLKALVYCNGGWLVKKGYCKTTVNGKLVFVLLSSPQEQKGNKVVRMSRFIDFCKKEAKSDYFTAVIATQLNAKKMPILLSDVTQIIKKYSATHASAVLIPDSKQKGKMYALEQNMPSQLNVTKTIRRKRKTPKQVAKELAKALP